MTRIAYCTTQQMTDPARELAMERGRSKMTRASADSSANRGMCRWAVRVFGHTTLTMFESVRATGNRLFPMAGSYRRNRS
jgi:hypothetical protein